MDSPSKMAKRFTALVPGCSFFREFRCGSHRSSFLPDKKSLDKSFRLSPLILNAILFPPHLLYPFALTLLTLLSVLTCFLLGPAAHTDKICYASFFNGPTSASFCLFSFFSNKFYRKKL